MSIKKLLLNLERWDNWSPEARRSFDAEIGAWDNLPKEKWDAFFKELDARELGGKFPGKLYISKFVELLDKELDTLTPESLLCLGNLGKVKERKKSFCHLLMGEHGEMFDTIKEWCKQIGKKGFIYRKILFKIFLQSLFQAIFSMLKMEKNYRKELHVLDRNVKIGEMGISLCLSRQKSLDYVSSGDMYEDISCIANGQTRRVVDYIRLTSSGEGYIDDLGSRPVYENIKPFIPMPLDPEMDCAVLRIAGLNDEVIKGIEKGDEKIQAFIAEMNKLREDYYSAKARHQDLQRYRDRYAMIRKNFPTYKFNFDTLYLSYEQPMLKLFDEREKLLNRREEITEEIAHKWNNIYFNLRELCLSIGLEIWVDGVVPDEFSIEWDLEPVLQQLWVCGDSSWDSDTSEVFNAIRKINLLLYRIVVPKREYWTKEERKTYSLIIGL